MQKILIANRGEIALRIMRSAMEMGIQTVAVYSEADETAPHVRFANEAVLLGPPPSSESYLKGNLIIEEAKKLGVDGIHPGYGFLAENAEFAEAITKAGIKFIGPSPAAIRTMGSKLAAKKAVKQFNIPIVPGTDHAIENIDEARNNALKIGFPILIKASAGGGGKGMRIVEQASEFEEQMKMAISEATSAFGDGSVFIEKYVPSPRHIEIQVLADEHGNIVHLFERECSIQRRHQKVIEEAPSSCLTPEIRTAMGKSAVDVARSCNYWGAGTVEFLLDEAMNYYFLEMNTRLQVEHPVTEMITGIDLVKEQIKIASGEKLSFTQEEITMNGHALELRVYAEDPANNFLPDIGRIECYDRPCGPGVRVDDGFEQGMDIPIYYDPMIAKLCTWGNDREEAIARMKRAITEYRITGFRNTLQFGKLVMEHPAFVSGKFDTHFIHDHFSPENLNNYIDAEAEIAAAVAAFVFQETKEKKNSNRATNGQSSSWKRNRIKIE